MECRKTRTSAGTSATGSQSWVSAILSKPTAGRTGTMATGRTYASDTGSCTGAGATARTGYPTSVLKSGKNSM